MRWRTSRSHTPRTRLTLMDRVHSRRYPPQDPVRPARNLYGVKLVEYEVPVEQGVQTYQILFVWGHDPSTHVRRARFLIHVGDLI